MNKEDIIKTIDKAISQLVYTKRSMLKAYNYYNGKRDPEQFKHLEENYGIGTPTQIEFIPLVRKHIDALVGEYTSVPTKPKISCKDEGTLTNIMREKQLAINGAVFQTLKRKLNNAMLNQFSLGQQAMDKDPLIEKELNQVVADLDRNFVSEYEIAAQNILTSTMQSRNIDFHTKKEELARDLFVTGTAYYQVRKSPSGHAFEFEVLNPVHTFIDRNPNSRYLKDSYRSVIRRYMNKHEIINKYGHLMDDSALAEVKKIDVGTSRNGTTYYVRSNELFGDLNEVTGLLGGQEFNPAIPTDKDGLSRVNNLIEVFEVEWLDQEKSKGAMKTYRYEGVRINGNIYLPIGKVESVRSVSKPNETCLSVNGMFFSDKNGEPYSLVLATASLQDKFDILHWYRDNVIASSGVKGDWLDVSMLPDFLGDDIVERIQKFVAYKKQIGVGIINTSQEGRAFNNNTTFAGYDDALKADVIQAFDIAIQSIEQTCSSITGVSRERLGGIEQRDAVSNVEVGVRMSAIITRQYFQALDTIIKEVLTDCLNISKVVYKKGITGAFILGDKMQQVFTALPEHYTITDFDIHVNDSSEFTKDIETIKMFTQELIKGQIVDAATAVDALDSKSMTELKISVKKGIEAQEEKMGQMSQLQQQVEQLQQQLQQAQQELQKTQQELQKATETGQNNSIEQQKVDVEMFKAKADKDYKDRDLELKKEQIKAEVLQLYDGDSKNDEIKNIT